MSHLPRSTSGLPIPALVHPRPGQTGLQVAGQRCLPDWRCVQSADTVPQPELAQAFANPDIRAAGGWLNQYVLSLIAHSLAMSSGVSSLSRALIIAVATALNR